MGDPFGSARLEYALRAMSKKDKREAFNLIRTANAVVFGWRLEKPPDRGWPAAYRAGLQRGNRE
jgi:hypothetical protein